MNLICSPHADGTSAERVLVFDVSESQLSTPLTEGDCVLIAAYFDNFEHYIDMFGLDNHQKADAERKGKDKNRLGIKEILACWIEGNGSSANYKELLNILSKLGKHEVARRVCTYVKENIPAHKPQ